MLAFGLIMPVVPSLIQELAHVPPEGATLWLGALAATYAVMNLLFGPVLGSLSDRFGRRPVLLASVATLAIDFLIMGFSHLDLAALPRARALRHLGRHLLDRQCLYCRRHRSEGPWAPSA